MEFVPDDFINNGNEEKKKKKNTEVLRDILVFIGEVILSISKTLTYQFHSK